MKSRGGSHQAALNKNGRVIRPGRSKLSSREFRV